MGKAKKATPVAYSVYNEGRTPQRAGAHWFSPRAERRVLLSAEDLEAVKSNQFLVIRSEGVVDENSGTSDDQNESTEGAQDDSGQGSTADSANEEF